MGKRGFFHEGKITPKKKMYLPILPTFPFRSILEMKVLLYLFHDNAREHCRERKIELKLFLTDKCFGKLAYQPHPIDKWRRNHSYFMNIESNIADVNREVACKRWVAIKLIDISAFPKKHTLLPCLTLQLFLRVGAQV